MFSEVPGFAPGILHPEAFLLRLYQYSQAARFHPDESGSEKRILYLQTRGTKIDGLVEVLFEEQLIASVGTNQGRRLFAARCCCKIVTRY